MNSGIHFFVKRLKRVEKVKSLAIVNLISELNLTLIKNKERLVF